MNLLIATRNQGKFEEIKSVMSSLQLRLLSLADFDVDDSDLEEDGETFEENARKKATYYAKKCGVMTLADDSGIVVDALRGELGVKTRRWGAGADASDEEWLDHFMRRMEGETDRRATFVTCACLADDTGAVLKSARGESRGEITNKIEAPIIPGIPLSSVFRVEDMEKVHAALTPEEKNRISHRGKAVRQICGSLSYRL